MNSTLPALSVRRPRWSVVAGLAIAFGGLLLTVATIIEFSLDESSAPPLVGLFCVLFLSAAAVQAGAIVPLAIGSGDGRGAAGGSLLGKAALLVFSTVLFTNQTLYVVTAYLLGEVSPTGPGFGNLSLALAVAQTVALFVGAIIIVRARVLVGAGRWAFLALAVVALATGLTVNASDDPAVFGTAYLVSTTAQLIVGVLIARARVTTAGQ